MTAGSGGDRESGDHRSYELPRILVAGGCGQLGRALADVGAASGRVTAASRSEFDLAWSAGQLEEVIRANEAGVVINAAAYTDVDGAENDEPGADAVNHLGAARLATACREVGVWLVHISTDYVFDGDVPAGGDPRTAPGLEPGDPVGPRTVYGRTKLVGEIAVGREHPGATVVRTAWVYTGPRREQLGLPGGDFVSTMMRLEAERDEIRVVDDQMGSPTWAGALAGGLLDAVGAQSTGEFDLRGLTVHATNQGRATWFEVARAVFRHLGADPERVRPCSTAEFPRPAPRPAFSVLSGESWAASGLAPLPAWEEDLAALFAPAAAPAADSTPTDPDDPDQRRYK